VRKRPLGKTGTFVTEMTLGTWGLSGDGYTPPIDPDEAERVIARAVDIGIRAVDTSDAYGAGKMEALLGKALASHPDVTIVTKGGTDRTCDPPRKRFDAAYLRGAVERSLKRLARDRIDVYLLHNPSSESLSLGEATETMAALKTEGKIAHWGVSVGDAATAKLAIDFGAEAIEIAYNLFHAIDLHRIAGDVMVGGAGVFARSPLAYGLLAGQWTSERLFPAGDHRADRWTHADLEKRVRDLDAIRFLVKDDVPTMRGAAIRYVLANHLVSSAVIGPRTVTQLEQLVRETGSGPIYLPDKDLATLPRALGKIGIPL